MNKYKVRQRKVNDEEKGDGRDEWRKKVHVNL